MKEIPCGNIDLAIAIEVAHFDRTVLVCRNLDRSAFEFTWGDLFEQDQRFDTCCLKRFIESLRNQGAGDNIQVTIAIEIRHLNGQDAGHVRDMMMFEGKCTFVLQPLNRVERL